MSSTFYQTYFLIYLHREFNMLVNVHQEGPKLASFGGEAGFSEKTSVKGYEYGR